MERGLPPARSGSLSTLLRDRRTALGVSASELAGRIGVHPMSIHRWERRERLPGPAHVRQLAQTLAIDVAEVAQFFDRARTARSVDPPRSVRGVGLRALRRSADVSVVALSQALAVPPAHVYNWEAGGARIPERHLPMLADLLGLEAERLRGLLGRARPIPEPPSSPLRRLRRRVGLSQSQAAHRLGTTRHRLGAWERGRGAPPLAVARRMSGLYGVPLETVARLGGVTVPTVLDRRTWAFGSLPDVLVALRAWAGITQSELAQRSGYSVGTIRSWERGVRMPSSAAAEALERAFGLQRGVLAVTLRTA